MKRFGTGLVVGKFCPLHHGHQMLLDQAQLQCSELVVISYTKPEFSGCEPDRRERWLASLYPDAVRLVLDQARLGEHCRRLGLAARTLPDNDAPDDVHRSFVAWLLQTVLQVEVDAVFTSEAYGDGFATDLTRRQADRDGPQVIHVAVDPGRAVVPVSGTAVRSDVHALRNRLDPIVYRDFILRVAILGGESTGKTHLARELAERLSTVHATEYGRELWELRNGALVEADMLRIAQTQVRREDTLALEANRLVICDTTPLTTMLYSQAMFGHAAAELEALAQRSYDLTFLCAPDVPFVQDGTRRDTVFRQWQHDWYVRKLEARRIRYRLLQGGWQERLAAAIDCISIAGGN